MTRKLNLGLAHPTKLHTNFFPFSSVKDQGSLSQILRNLLKLKSEPSCKVSQLVGFVKVHWHKTRTYLP